MRIIGLLLAAFAGLSLVTGVYAEDKKEEKKDEKKEVTLKGNLVCAKCALKEKGVTKCTTVIQVKENGKDVNYYFDDKGSKEDYHEDVCGGAKKAGTVKGTVTEKDGKKYIKPTKVEFDKT